MPEDIEDFEDRLYTGGKPGRLDVNGIEWWACDPYPTWYRWVDRELITEGWGDWADGKDDYFEKGQ